jgi:Methyltransferase FkbM domain
MRGTGLTRSVQVAGDAAPNDLIVPLATLAELLHKVNPSDIRTPVLVKLDLEGHELAALRGAGDWLAEGKVAVWCIEANTQAEAKAIDEVMRGYGYSLQYYLPEQRKLVSQRPSPCHQSNLIFVRDLKAAAARLALGKALSLFGKKL